MNKLFVFQKDKDHNYTSELDFIYQAAKSIPDTYHMNSEELTIQYLIDNKIQVIISNGLTLEWYLILTGLRVVTVTIDNLDIYKDNADIIIDFKSNNRKHFFTGEEYSVCKNVGKIPEVIEIFGLINKLEWDSKFFGFNVAFLSSRYLTENIMFYLDKFIREEKIRLVEYLCNCHDSRSVLLAEKNGFHFTDIRLTFEKKINISDRLHSKNEYKFGIAGKEHKNKLRDIAGGIYQDSRYYFDGNFDNKKIDEFYRDWVEKAVYGLFDNECYCLFEGENPIGFCTIKYLQKHYAQIGLLGIDSRYQGKGLANILINSVCNSIYKNEIHTLYVVTQGRNYAAQRLYQKAGFLTKSTELWYHKWL